MFDTFFANLEDPMATPLHRAALLGNLGEVQALLAAEPGTCKAVDSHGWTALHWAAAAGQPQCVPLLVRAGASLEARGDESHTPWMAKLRLPAAAGRPADLAFDPFNSHDSKATEGATPLHVAAAMGHVECVRQLLHLQACPAAANSLGFTALHLATACNQLETLRELVRGGADAAAESGTRFSPCHVAAACDSLECLRELIRLGLGSCIQAPASDSWTPLHYAAAAGAAGSVQVLLAAGADVEGKPVESMRPLHVAALFGHTEVARVLIAAGADIEAQGIAGTALHFAALWGHIETALALVAAGADMEAVGPSGGQGSRTPLLEATAYGNVDFVSALAAAGADVKAQTGNGCTRLHWFAVWVADTKAEDAVPRLQVLLDAGAIMDLVCSHQPTPVDILLVMGGGPPKCNLPACVPELIRLMAAAGCPVSAPLTMRDGTSGIAAVMCWLRSLALDDWAAQWPATLSGTVVDIGVALLQSAAAEAGMGSTDDGLILIKLAMATGSTPLVLASLDLLPEDFPSLTIMILASMFFMGALKALPNPGWGAWGERHRQVVHHYCGMAEALLAAGCAPPRTSSGQDISRELFQLPGWAAPHLRELLQVVTSGQRWSPGEAHRAFPPAFCAATRALLLANHRGLATPVAPGSGDTTEPQQMVDRPPGGTRARVQLPQGVVLLILAKAAHPPAAWVPQLQPGGHAPRSRAGVGCWKLGVALAAAATAAQLAMAAVTRAAGVAVAYMRRRWVR
ncbi:hypothetical protein N2152v2_008687 [Parachlorella kessleri]